MTRARDLADRSAVHGRRNLIINGAMQVAQRGDATGKTSDGYYACDRFLTVLNSSGTFSVSQSTEAPDGFKNSMKWDCTTADSSPNYFVIYHYIEGQNVAHTEGGTSNAKNLTLSFWVRSNKTGTYQVNMRRYISDSVERLLGYTYTIDTADTWEKKVITFIGDTGGSATRNTNEIGLVLEWWLAAGSSFTTGTRPTAWETTTSADRAADLSVNIGASTDDEFYITGVQLEVGEKATPFEHRSYGEELLACQRYCHVWKSTQTYDAVCMMTTWNANTFYGTYSYPVEMRADPTVTYSGDFQFVGSGTSITGGVEGTNRIGRYVTNTRYDKTSHGRSSGSSGWLRDSNDSDATITFDAEL